MWKRILEAGGKQYEVIEGEERNHRYCTQCMFWKNLIYEEPCKTCCEDFLYHGDRKLGRILKPIE